MTIPKGCISLWQIEDRDCAPNHQPNVRPVKKTVEDDDSSGIGWKYCNSWFHSDCVGLSIDSVKWLGTQRNCLWCCDACLDKGDCLIGASAKTEAKLNLLFNSFSTKVNTSMSELIPKAIKDTVPLLLKENVSKAVADSIPSYSDVVGGNFVGEKKEMQFVITDSTETEDSYLKQIEKDVDEVNKILKHMGLSSDGNVSEIRRLGRSHNPANKEKRACRPLLITGSGRFGTRRFGNKMAEDVSATFCCRNVFGAETSSQQVKDVSATFCDFFWLLKNKFLLFVNVSQNFQYFPLLMWGHIRCMHARPHRRRDQLPLRSLRDLRFR